MSRVFVGITSTTITLTGRGLVELRVDYPTNAPQIAISI